MADHRNQSQQISREVHRNYLTKRKSIKELKHGQWCSKNKRERHTDREGQMCK